jgi:hypothetical protein
MLPVGWVKFAKGRFLAGVLAGEGNVALEKWVCLSESQLPYL